MAKSKLKSAKLKICNNSDLKLGCVVCLNRDMGETGVRFQSTEQKCSVDMPHVCMCVLLHGLSCVSAKVLGFCFVMWYMIMDHVWCLWVSFVCVCVCVCGVCQRATCHTLA